MEGALILCRAHPLPRSGEVGPLETIAAGLTRLLPPALEDRAGDRLQENSILDQRNRRRLRCWRASAGGVHELRHVRIGSCSSEGLCASAGAPPMAR
jgi:hypothetical protein